MQIRLRVAGIGLGLMLPMVVGAQGLLPECNPLPGNAGPGTEAHFSCISGCETAECRQGCSRSCTIADVFQVLLNIYNLLLGLSAFVAILFVIYGGIKMVTQGYMEDSESELKAGKDTIRRAIVGLVIVMLSWIIVNTIVFVLGGGGIQTIIGSIIGAV